MNRARRVLLDGLATSGKELVIWLATLSADEIFAAPAPDEWNIHQNLAHLRDVEQHVFLARTLCMLKEAHPMIVAFDQNAWHRAHYAPDEPLKNILGEFRAARRKLLSALRRATAKDWANWAAHPEFGKISLEWIALHSYQHTLDHHAQIIGMREKRVLAKLQEAK